MPYLYYVKISRAYIIILQIDILSYDEMLWLLNTWNICITLRYQELTSQFYMLISYHMMNCYDCYLSHLKCKTWKWVSSLDIIFREIYHDRNHDGNIDKLKSFKLINTPIMIPIMMYLSEDDVKAWHSFSNFTLHVWMMVIVAIHHIVRYQHVKLWSNILISLHDVHISNILASVAFLHMVRYQLKA